MSQNRFNTAQLPDPSTAPELFDGVLLRRVFAFCIDMLLVGFVLMLLVPIGVIAGFLTLGLGWLATLIAVPVVILGYYAATLGSHRRATVGMMLMDLVLTPTRGQPLNGLSILIHPFVFWVTIWLAWPLSLLFALFTPRQQMVHDYIAGTLMLRRSPMVRHWRSQAAGARP
jgi:uncharacterized RDD family membrane protein YckC